MLLSPVTGRKNEHFPSQPGKPELSRFIGGCREGSILPPWRTGLAMGVLPVIPRPRFLPQQEGASGVDPDTVPPF